MKSLLEKRFEIERIRREGDETKGFFMDKEWKR